MSAALRPTSSGPSSSSRKTGRRRWARWSQRFASFGNASHNLRDGSRGDDELAGNDGIDRVDYGRSDGPVTVDLATGEATGDGSDMLVGVERLVGSRYDDSLTGDSNANAISGGEGNDILSGEEGDDSLMGDAGDDLLDGGPETDTLDGGVGSDVCVNGEALLDCES